MAGDARSNSSSHQPLQEHRSRLGHWQKQVRLREVIAHIQTQARKPIPAFAPSAEAHFFLDGQPIGLQLVADRGNEHREHRA